MVDCSHGNSQKDYSRQALVAEALDFVLAARYTKRYGGTSHGMWGAVVGGLIGAIVGVPSLRIKGTYLAIATLASQLIIEWVINHTPAISGGSS